MPPATDIDAVGAPNLISADASAGDKPAGDAPLGMTQMRSALPMLQSHVGAADEEVSPSAPPTLPADSADAQDGGKAMTQMRSALPPSMSGPNDHQMAHQEYPAEADGAGRRPDEESRGAMTQMRSAIAVPPDAANASQEASCAAMTQMRSAIAVPPDAGNASQEASGAAMTQMRSAIAVPPDAGNASQEETRVAPPLTENAVSAKMYPSIGASEPEVKLLQVNRDLELDSETALRLGSAKNWHLTSSELRSILRAAGIEPHELLNDADLRQRLSEKVRAELRHVLLTALRSVDKSRDGYFTFEDLRQALSLGTEVTTRLHLARLHGQDPAAGHWISREGLLNYLEKHRADVENCLALPFALLFFILFFVLMTWHARMETAGALSLAVEDAMNRPDLSKNFPDSAWTWLASHAEPNMIVPHTPNIGGVRFIILGRGEETVAEHKPKALCDYFRSEFHVDALVGGLHDKPKLCGSSVLSVVWLHWPLQRDEVESALLGSRQAWEIRQTVYPPLPHGVALQFLAQSSKTDFYALYTHTIHFDETGLPLSKTSISSFTSKPVWHDLSEDGEDRIIMVLDMIFCGMIILQILLEFYKMLSKGKCCTGKRYTAYVSIWSLCRWLNMIMALLLVLLYDFGEHQTHGLNQLVSDLPILDQARRYTSSDFTAMLLARNLTLDSYELQLNGILEQGQRVADVWDEMYWYVAVMAVCTCLRLIEACRGNPRLNVTISTLKRSASDILHLIVMLLAVVTIFVLIGHMIYGSRIEAFSTGYQAFESTMLFLAGYTYNSLHSKIVEVGGILGIVWVFILNIIVVLLLVHVAISMVLYVYPEARHGNTDAWTLKQHMISIFTNEGSGVNPQSRERFSFGRVRRALQNGAHPGELVSSASLSIALGANDRDAQSVLDCLLKKAREDQQPEETTASAADIERIYGRVDTNVRALDQVVRGIGSSLESASLREGMIEMPVPRWLPNPDAAGVESKTNPVSHDIKVEDLTAVQLPTSQQEAALPPVAANVEEAPFEGVTFGETWELEDHLEERVSQLEKADVENCARLERQIVHLGDMLNKLQAQRHAGVVHRRDRLFQMENMLEDMVEHFRPLFERLP